MVIHTPYMVIQTSYMVIHAPYISILGSHLAVLKSSAENEFVKGIGIANQKPAMWIGLNDKEKEGVFKWVRNLGDCTCAISDLGWM